MMMSLRPFLTPKRLVLFAAFSLLLGGSPSLQAADIPLKKEDPIPVSGTHGRFDFLAIDSKTGRLVTPHAGNGTLDLFDAVSGKLLQVIPTGKAQGVAVDPEAGKYYVSVSKEKKLVIVDSSSFTILGEISLPGEADVLAFDSRNHTAYIGHDDATEVWAVDVKALKIVASIPIPEGPEAIVYDAAHDRVYANSKSGNVVVVIDPTSNQAVASWATAPAQAPHGSAIDSKGNRLFVAGGNGKLVAIDLGSGKVVADADIAPKVDQIAYDPGLNRVYCASGTGVLSVVDAAQGLRSLGDIPTQPGAHSVAVDPKSHGVLIAYAADNNSPAFIECLK